ncbi:MAG: GNAT family N-acetyltransferase [Balneolaceae bacterium]|nr:GNAT family N-acetyltransferase [Balneolaceae bacterium]
MITRAREEHLSRIDEIYNQAVRDGLRTAHLNPLTRRERREWFAGHKNEQFPVFVWLEDGTVWGWLSVSPYRSGRDALGEVAEISYYVDYQKHGEGIASELMRHAITFCKRASLRILVAILISGNDESIGLLEKFRFRESGRIERAIHYKDLFRDHVYMSLNIE